MQDSTEKITWQHLKEFANSLSEEQLKNPVRVWGEDEHYRISFSDCLEEDYYVDLIDDGYSLPESEWECAYGGDKQKKAIAHKKGTPILYIYF